MEHAVLPRQLFPDIVELYIITMTLSYLIKTIFNIFTHLLLCTYRKPTKNSKSSIDKKK